MVENVDSKDKYSHLSQPLFLLCAQICPTLLAPMLTSALNVSHSLPNVCWDNCCGASQANVSLSVLLLHQQASVSYNLACSPGKCNPSQRLDPWPEGRPETEFPAASKIHGNHKSPGDKTKVNTNIQHHPMQNSTDLRFQREKGWPDTEQTALFPI